MKLTVLLPNGDVTQMDDDKLVAGLRIPVLLEELGDIEVRDIADLVRTEGTVDNDVERTRWIEYRLKTDADNPRAVHRSVDMYLKQGLLGVGIAASL